VCARSGLGAPLFRRRFPLVERAVADALGEPIATVRRLGFGLMTLARPAEPDDLRLVLDCPFCGHAVPYLGRSRDGSLALAECLRCDVYFDFAEVEVYATSESSERAA
jgi:hypothetical protein